MITTFFPFDPNPARLERLALEHARELDSAHGSDSSEAPMPRLVVNYLRHECTDYDLDQSHERHRAACEAIGRRFPWLAEEAERQIARRAARDAGAEEDRRALAAQERDRREERRAMVARSREVIKGMYVGQRVGLRFGRYRYTGVITGLGRSRATVAYRIATGRDRDRVRLVHAALLTPVEEDRGNRPGSPIRRSASSARGVLGADPYPVGLWMEAA